MRKQYTRKRSRRITPRHLMRAMFALRHTHANPLGATDVARKAAARVQQLSDANLRGPRSGKPAVPPCAAVFERIAEEFPEFDTLLLCWGVWIEDRQASLAPDIIWPGTELGSTSYKAMAQRLHARRFREHRKPSVRYEVRSKKRA